MTEKSLEENYNDEDFEEFEDERPAGVNIVLSLKKVRGIDGRCKLYDYCPYQSCGKKKWETNRDNCFMLSEGLYQRLTVDAAREIRVSAFNFIPRR